AGGDLATRSAQRALVRNGTSAWSDDPRRRRPGRLHTRPSPLAVPPRPCTAPRPHAAATGRARGDPGSTAAATDAGVCYSVRAPGRDRGRAVPGGTRLRAAPGSLSGPGQDPCAARGDGRGDQQPAAGG